MQATLPGTEDTQRSKHRPFSQEVTISGKNGKGNIGVRLLSKRADQSGPGIQRRGLRRDDASIDLASSLLNREVMGRWLRSRGRKLPNRTGSKCRGMNGVRVPPGWEG